MRPPATAGAKEGGPDVDPRCPLPAAAPGSQIPLWTGYTLGFHLVGEHMARTGRSAADLVHAPSGDFRPGGGG